jgi:predicted ATPase
VVELCQRLDGIPLAIELSAVWLRTLSAAQILERLEDRFLLLRTGWRSGPPRQQALEAAVGWSHDLCSPAEQLMWARLSVFSGGFDLEGAEQVCHGDGITRDEVLNLVASLVNKSILVRHPGTEHATGWYQMLETVRQYGAAQLSSPDEARQLRIRHRDRYHALAAQYQAESFGPQQARTGSSASAASTATCVQPWTSASMTTRRPLSRSPPRSGTSGSPDSCGRVTSTSPVRSTWPPSRPPLGHERSGRPATSPCSPRSGSDRS